jgi:hypothetical protein
VNTKTLGLIITFASLAIVLNPSISGLGIPFPPLPTLIFQIWEIPTVAAFLLFGPKIGIPVAGINSVFLVAVYPGMSRPFYGIGSFFSVTSMMLGFLLMYKLVARHSNHETKTWTSLKVLAASIPLGALFRVLIMAPYTFSVYSFLTYPPTAASRLLYYVLPFQAVFNMIVPLYMIPAGYGIAKVISKNLKIGNELV